jgi:hypothetical protein
MNWIARIFMGLLGLGFLAALLLGLLCYTVYAAFRWLLTGRKPQVVMVWQQFSSMRKGAAWAGRGGQSGSEAGHEAPGQGDIVDVEVREIRPDTPQDKWLK